MGFIWGAPADSTTFYFAEQAMLRSAGARRLRKTLRRCPAGAKIAQRIVSWTWDVKHERALSPADLFGGKAPVGALIGLLERIC